LSEAQIEALAAHGHRSAHAAGRGAVPGGDPAATSSSSCREGGDRGAMERTSTLSASTAPAGSWRAKPAHRADRVRDCVVREPGEVLVVPAGGCATSSPRIRRWGPDPARLPAAPFPADRARNRLPDHRIPLSCRHPPAARGRRPQPPAAPVYRPGTGQGGGGLAPPAGRPPGGDAGGHSGGDRVLRNPTNAELADLLGLRRPAWGSTAHDFIIVGAGPAGLAAAVYGASEGLPRSSWRLSRREARRDVPRGSRITSASRPGSRRGARGTGRHPGREVRRADHRPAEAVALEQGDGRYAVRLDDAHRSPAWRS